MIELKENSREKPYLILRDLYKKALSNSQKNVEAISISSYDKEKNEVNSRFVNLKYIENDKWVFFTNYNSPKSKDFASHPQISAILFWNQINIQIRIKANIEKLPSDKSDTHFLKRDLKKNALAISSKQSFKAKSYDDIRAKYIEVLNSKNNHKRPDYWGGYSFTPYYFEFWEGHDLRLNKRDLYEKDGDIWNHSFLQP